MKVFQLANYRLKPKKKPCMIVHAGFFYILMLVSITAPFGFWRIRLGKL